MNEMNKFVEMDFINADNLDYKSAIELGVKLLEKNKKATINLKDAILESMKKNGPYFIVSPMLALAHAAPGNYCLEPSMSLIVFDKPISFSKDKKHDVQVLVTLSAPDATSHMDLIVWFAKVFGNQEIVDKLCKVKSINEIKTILGD